MLLLLPIAGTGVDKSDDFVENITGFLTKFGDGGADVSPPLSPQPTFRGNNTGRQECTADPLKKFQQPDLEEDKPGLADESNMSYLKRLTFT